MTRRIFPARPVGREPIRWQATIGQGGAQTIPGSVPAAADPVVPPEECACADVALAWLPDAMKTGTLAAIDIDVTGDVLTILSTDDVRLAFVTVGQIIAGMTIDVSALLIKLDLDEVVITPVLMVDTDTVRVWYVNLPVSAFGSGYGTLTVSAEVVCGGVTSTLAPLTAVFAFLDGS